MSTYIEQNVLSYLYSFDVGDGYPSALIEQNDTILEQPTYLPELTSKYITAAKHFIKSSVGQENMSLFAPTV